MSDEFKRWSGGGGESMTCEDYVARCLDGDDYGRGALEAASETARNTAKTLAKLIALLHAQDLLTTEEVKGLV